MISSRFVPNNNTNAIAKTPSNKVYQLVGSNEKPVNVRNYCSSISWFIIITCSILSLFLACQNSSIFFRNHNTRIMTLDVVRHEPNRSPVSVTVNPDVRSMVKNPAESSENSFAGKSDECAGKYIYVLNLPGEFGSDLLDNCSTLNPWADACTLLSNSGLGPHLNFTDDTVFSGPNWYNTDQWSLEVIFHSRLKQYSCLTDNYSEASAVFVPYYSGLDVGRYLWISNATLRDETSIKFAKHVSQRPEWKAFGGRDHFLLAGRMTWDFSRGSEDTSAVNGWGNRLLQLPEIKNMTTLLLESGPYMESEIAIPYPTYFHPSTRKEVDTWQQKMRQKNRPHLFSFAGAPRPNNKESIRNILIDQCLASKNCKHVLPNSDVKPETIMGLFQASHFCLQPPGDSLTRKSIFDTIIAGCIPVLFHPGSAYVQYIWHLPKDYSSYSVYIPMDELQQGNVSIEQRLLQIPKEKIRAMREEVIKLIPKIVYANPNYKVDDLEDAFEVTLKGILNRVKCLKIELKGMKDDSTWEHNGV